MIRQETCDNDDDYTIGWREELPPGVEGCLRPQKPPNSFLRVTTNHPVFVFSIINVQELYFNAYLYKGVKVYKVNINS